jgi:hypothetical protein
MRDLEYDSFGPWVIEISEVDPPSPIFRPFLTRQETPLLSIKIPRSIDHRDARPDMNLYDFLVSLYRDDLVILQLSGEKIIEHTLPYCDIQYLRYSEELLAGNVRLGLPGSTLDLKFNTVSSGIMKRLVDLIRERFSMGTQLAPLLDEISAPLDDLSFYFKGLIDKTDQQTPQFHLLAAQPNTPVTDNEPASLGNIFFKIIGKTLLESLHWSDGRELMIVTRGQEFKYKWQANYTKETTYLPLANISAVHWQPKPRHTAVSQLAIETPAGPLSFLFTADNPFIPSYDRFLEAVSSPFRVEKQTAGFPVSAN